ncbi:hypothetical protein SAMN06297251_1523 [Fulvimarina manganoxydans]|uniref:Uncharacterized protein n=1 Tax=Fulvimarina manganoxydans TaxID=937218 RepID=A0A1W2F339_9HYPH|nr:hypothetical protein [Fulvimarina manganoxydans]SMD15858.1 hypothetical protein SAMN06297251_1523 [Fulvimarina manganoxydans]
MAPLAEVVALDDVRARASHAASQTLRTHPISQRDGYRLCVRKVPATLSPGTRFLATWLYSQIVDLTDGRSTSRQMTRAFMESGLADDEGNVVVEPCGYQGNRLRIQLNALVKTGFLRIDRRPGDYAGDIYTCIDDWKTTMLAKPKRIREAEKAAARPDDFPFYEDHGPETPSKRRGHPHRKRAPL